MKVIYCVRYYFQPGEIEKKYNGLLEKKWTSVIRLQKKVRPAGQGNCQERGASNKVKVTQKEGGVV